MARGKYLISQVVMPGMQGRVLTRQRVAFEYCNPFSMWLKRLLNGPDTLISRMILSIFFACTIRQHRCLIQRMDSLIKE